MTIIMIAAGIMFTKRSLAGETPGIVVNGHNGLVVRYREYTPRLRRPLSDLLVYPIPRRACEPRANVAQIRNLARGQNVNIAGCLEKADIVRCIINSKMVSCCFEKGSRAY